MADSASVKVAEWLTAARLGQHEAALRAAGVAEAEDLEDLDDGMLTDQVYVLLLLCCCSC